MAAIYGKGRKPAVDLKIEKIKNALIGFAKQEKYGKNWKEKQYKEKRKAIIEK